LRWVSAADGHVSILRRQDGLMVFSLVGVPLRLRLIDPSMLKAGHFHLPRQPDHAAAHAKRLHTHFTIACRMPAVLCGRSRASAARHVDIAWEPVPSLKTGIPTKTIDLPSC
jgi:hypothetical protein